MMTRWLLLSLLLMLSGIVTVAQDDVPLFSPEEDFYVDATVSSTTPYVGEAITYTFRFFDGSSRRAIETLPEFEGFWHGTPTTNSRAEIVGERQYILTTFEIVLYPLDSGDIPIEPTTVLITDEPGQPPQRLQTFGFVINVQPLPENPPIGFDGAVGQFDMSVFLTVDTLTAGEPATFQMRILGSGNLEQLRPPIPPVPDDWHVIEQPTTTQQTSVVTERIFEWVVIPGHAGAQTVRALVFSFFDPRTGTYRSVASDPIIVEVLPNPNPGELLPIENTASSAPAIRTELRPISRVDNESSNLSAIFWLLWLITPAIAFVVWRTQIRAARRTQQQALVRQSQALRTAQSRLQEAIQQREIDAMYKAIDQAVVGYCTDRLNKSDVQITQIQAHLAQQGIANSLISKLQMCIDQIEMGRYAPVQAMDIKALIKQTADILSAIDKAWNAQ